ncbi:MAG: phosphoribosylanthranilate isomerase [Candidatus Eisenbacteria bacterium]
MVGVKICGLTRLEDALVALDAGAEALGFVLAANSPRTLTPAAARALVGAVRAHAARPFEAVAVLGAYEAGPVRRALSELGFDRAQIVGRDAAPQAALVATLAELGALAGRTWGGIRVKDGASLEGIDDAPCEAFVLDAHAQGALGGTGHAFDWALAAPFAARRRVVLAGGLTADNVASAIRVVRPWRVDVSSGVEDTPGIKSAVKIRAFMEAARHGNG